MSLGFKVHGWSRTPKSLAGVASHTGDAGLAEMLPQCDMLVCLLPLTPQTRGLLSAKLFDRMKQGAALELDIIADNVERVRRGEAPLYQVDVGAGY